jgi:preprotein translocase subunit SecY
MQSIRKNTKKEGITERILLTLGLLILSRLGTFIPVPGVDYDAFY